MRANYPHYPYSHVPYYAYPYAHYSAYSKPKMLTNMKQTLPLTKQIKDLPQFLDQLQHILKTTQSFAPYIKQYGPLIKSLPEKGTVNDQRESNDTAASSCNQCHASSLFDD